MGPHPDGDIDKATRTHAMWCVDHLDELLRLRENMGLTQRLTAKSPNDNAPSLGESAKELDKPKSETKPETRVQKIERELEAVAAERDKWKREAEKDGSLFDLKQDTAGLIAKVIVSHVSPYKVGEILKALTAERDRLKAARNKLVDNNVRRHVPHMTAHLRLDVHTKEGNGHGIELQSTDHQSRNAQGSGNEIRHASR